jgi:Mrp family chromosome partitioning ATPase
MRIAVASGKGGIRKTILATNLAEANVLVTKTSRRLRCGRGDIFHPIPQNVPGAASDASRTASATAHDTRTRGAGQ